MLADSPVMASLPASDIERAKTFYADKLGLKSTREDAAGNAYFEAGGASCFLYASEFAGSNQATAAAFLVQDCAQEVAALKANGVVFEEYDFGEFKTVDSLLTLPDGSIGAWFKDSEGNILGLFEEAQ